MNFRLLVLAFVFSLSFCAPPVKAQNTNTTFRAKLTFPGQTLANIWGYESRGREYALVGASKGLVIVDITNPVAPQQIVQIPGPDNLWKEIKTYRRHAYITSEGGGGIQIVDLRDLPSATLQSHFYTGNGAIAGQLGSIHALHIDETKGFLYAWGSGLFGGGAVILDLKQDPYNPVYVGNYSQLGYIHDGYVDNDTMYSCHIYAGLFAVVNMSNKSAPELINTQPTPSLFPHNTWLSPDRRSIFATDEKENSFLSSWDVSDPTDIKFLDKIQSNPGSNSIVHNTYAYKNWAVTSWYRDGFTLVDITRPDNLIQVGNYDTHPSTGGGFVGCWGVYPYFKSGNIIASNIGAPGELFVITPDYQRACYLEGKITDASTGLNLPNAQVQVIGTNPLLQEVSAQNGLFKTGQRLAGQYLVRITKSGYQPYETYITLQKGAVVELNVALYPNTTVNISGTVIRFEDGQPVENASVWLYGAQNFGPASTDMTGAYNFSNIPAGNYSIVASAMGLGSDMLSNQNISADGVYNLALYTVQKRDELFATAASRTENTYLNALQNPFSVETTLHYQLPATGARLRILNSLGEVFETLELTDNQGEIKLGAAWSAGIYFVAIQQNGQVLELKKLIKI